MLYFNLSRTVGRSVYTFSVSVILIKTWRELWHYTIVHRKRRFRSLMLFKKYFKKFYEKISLCFPVNLTTFSKAHFYRTTIIIVTIFGNLHFYRTTIIIVTIFGNLLYFSSGLIRRDYNWTWDFFTQQRKAKKSNNTQRQLKMNHIMTFPCCLVAYSCFSFRRHLHIMMYQIKEMYTSCLNKWLPKFWHSLLIYLFSLYLTFTFPSLLLKPINVN